MLNFWVLEDGMAAIPLGVALVTVILVSPIRAEDSWASSVMVSSGFQPYLRYLSR